MVVDGITYSLSQILPIIGILAGMIVGLTYLSVEGQKHRSKILRARAKRARSKKARAKRA